MPSLDLATDEVQTQIRKPAHQYLVGISEAMQEVRDLVEQVAPSDLAVLITGETGTGKDLVARILHAKSLRRNEAFIKFHCPGQQETLIENELFGHEKGAFTGAFAASPGRLERAHKGTLFLDEFSETSLAVQSKLLLALDGEPVVRIGGVESRPADVRVIAATNVPLDILVQQGRLHRDALFRLTEVVIHLPPLRDHAEDVPVLAEHFNFNLCRQFGKSYEPLPSGALQEMQTQAWPGNARELAARVKEYLITGSEEALAEPDAVARAARDAANPALSAYAGPLGAAPGSAAKRPPARAILPLKEATRRAVEETERALIEEALRYTLWNRRKAAKMLHISYSSLLRRIDAYHIGRS